MKNVPTFGTKPEVHMATILRSLEHNDFVTNYPLKLKCRAYPVIPDILFPRQKVVVEVAGAYWHKSSIHKTRALRIKKDEAKRACLENNEYVYLEFDADDVNLAHDYLTRKQFKNKARARRAEKVFNEIKAAIDEALKGR